VETELEVLRGATVVLGVTGGISAYKAVDLCRRLVDLGVHVVPVLTHGAEEFVGRATFSALASEPAHSSLFHEPSEPIPHTRLARRADLILVAPATASFLGAYRAGLALDLLTATLLATTAPVVVCPAMHTEMWEHEAVRDNVATLTRRGVLIVAPEAGRLAGGDVGDGRLAAPETILAGCATALGRRSRSDLTGRRILVTAGGTREPIDPVRYLANRSSGKQGHALARAAAARGAEVTLVTASGLASAPSVERVEVETAAEMAAAVASRAPGADVVVMAAAVADFAPVAASAGKLHRGDGPPTLELRATPDILALVVASARPGQLVVGFAAETEDVLARGAAKLRDKRVDLLVVNDVTAPGVGFGHDTNAVAILGRDGEEITVPLSSKEVVADAILDAVAARLCGASPTDRPRTTEPSKETE
jgi:phosphopantothenoylcysteine decarboxylase/phosphopantothenate--cysteine ligase